MDFGLLMSLLGGLTYFEYQRRICVDVVVPWLEKRVLLEGVSIADIGAHQGGMIDALRELGTVSSAMGMELRGDLVKTSPLVRDEHFRLEVVDLMAVEETASRFDLVVLHDVLEHIPDVVGALQQVTKLVRPGGFVFISFPPYYSAFGGHQQLARGRSRVIPFIHLLPERAFFRLAHPGDQEYMSSQDSLADMVSVRRSRLTLRKIERALSRTPLSWVDRELFVIRPEYGVRYGLKTRSARGLGKVPGLREFVINGAFYLAQRRGRE